MWLDIVSSYMATALINIINNKHITIVNVRNMPNFYFIKIKKISVDSRGWLAQQNGLHPEQPLSLSLLQQL